MKCSLVFSCLLSGFTLFSPLLSATSIDEYLGRPEGKPLHEESYTVNSQVYLPPPPQEGDAAYENDKALYQQSLTLRDSPRWLQAAEDADMRVVTMAKIFSPLLEVKIDKASTPATWYLLGDLLMAGAAYSGNSAKKYYSRTRPFVMFNNRSCQPEEDEASMRKNGAYPSGHTAYATLVALVLSQIKPEHAEQVMKRGYEMGDSRRICGAHWQSDVDAGRYVGAVEYARLQTLPAFITAVEQAKKELNR